MTQTQQQRQQTVTNRQVLEQLAALFAAELTGYILVMAVTRLLGMLTPPLGPILCRWLAMMTAGGNRPGDLGVPMGPCQEQEAEHANAWLALYLVAAADRLTTAQGAGPDALNAAKGDEERYYQLHQQAEERRMRAAALQDMAARLNGDREKAEAATLLGWRAVIDNRTTLECAAANGSNFKADQMPLIGWPGAVHNRCRCSAGPMVPGAPLLPSV